LTPFVILAQTTAPATQTAATTQPDAPFFVRFLRDGSLMPLILGILVLYIFVFRSKRKQDAQKRDQLKTLARGAKVQTIGGIIGTVIEARDDEVLLKVDETNNTKLRFSRNAIHRVLEEKNDK
jgi:preprotein translocase subunit YajC